MTDLHVTLPETATDFIDAQVAAGQFATPSEYVRFLVEQAQAAVAKKKLDDLLDEGLNSGPPIQFCPDWWQERKAAMLAKLPAGQSE